MAVKARQWPDFRTITDFRKQHLPALSGLFTQVLQLCQQARLVCLDYLTLDRTKIRASALHEDVAYGVDRGEDELPRWGTNKQHCLERIRTAKAAFEAEAQAFGVSPSAVSQKMVALTARNLKAFQTRPLAECTPFALFLDTIHRGGEAFLVALGVDVSGEKMALGFGQGSSEHHEICEALFRDLERRGLALSRRILFVTDGGRGLRKALRERFGKKVEHQRCAIHKSRICNGTWRSGTATRPTSDSRPRWSSRTTPKLGRCCLSWKRGCGPRTSRQQTSAAT